jgi:aminocarboxymuconate-semialdehyde decarboxylase
MNNASAAAVKDPCSATAEKICNRRTSSTVRHTFPAQRLFFSPCHGFGATAPAPAADLLALLTADPGKPRLWAREPLLSVDYMAWRGDVVTTPGTAVVDVHAHTVPLSLLADLKSRPVNGFAAARTDKGWVVTVPGAGPRPIAPGMTDLAPRRAWMERTGVTEQVLSPWTDVQYGDLPPREARDWAWRLNDAMAETASAMGGDTLILASVPPGETAAEDLRTVWERPETAGVVLSTHPPGGTALHDPAFEDLWAAAERDSVPIMLHPPSCGPSTALPAIARMGNVHGRLVDNSVAVAGLILHGVLDRYPGLILLLVHGGGYLPYQAARLDGGHRTREAFAGELARGHPSAYLADLYYDTAALSGPSIAFLVRLVGADQVLLGSDHPFPIGTPEPVRTVLGAGLAPDETAAILGGNAASILRRR